MRLQHHNCKKYPIRRARFCEEWRKDNGFEVLATMIPDVALCNIFVALDMNDSTGTRKAGSPNNMDIPSPCIFSRLKPGMGAAGQGSR
jgi:hypothetical protein